MSFYSRLGISRTELAAGRSLNTLQVLPPGGADVIELVRQRQVTAAAVSAALEKQARDLAAARAEADLAAALAEEDPWMDRESISGVKNSYLVYGGGGLAALGLVIFLMRKKT
jgi:hypothetical protein